MDFKHRYIAIEGNIGAGKTSVVELLANKLGAGILLEEFDNNPFLPAFYKEPDKHAFSTELFFLTERYHQQKKYFEQKPPLTISDYFIGKSLAFTQATLSGHQLELYKNIYNALVHELPQPDLIIYLKRPITYLQHKIGERGRKYEEGISTQYLEQIEKSYALAFKSIVEKPIVEVNCYDTDFYATGVLDRLIMRILKQNWSIGMQSIDFKDV